MNKPTKAQAEVLAWMRSGYVLKKNTLIGYVYLEREGDYANTVNVNKATFRAMFDKGLIVEERNLNYWIVVYKAAQAQTPHTRAE